MAKTSTEKVSKSKTTKVTKAAVEKKKRAKPKRLAYRTTTKRALTGVREKWETKANENYTGKDGEHKRKMHIQPGVAEAFRTVLLENANALGAKASEYSRMHLGRKTLSAKALTTIMHVKIPNKKLLQYIHETTEEAMSARREFKAEHAEENKAAMAKRKSKK